MSPFALGPGGVPPPALPGSVPNGLMMKGPMMMHPLIQQFNEIKGVPQEHWFRNAVTQLVTVIQPMLDRLDVLEAEKRAQTEQAEPDEVPAKAGRR